MASVDGAGVFTAAELLALHPAELAELIAAVAAELDAGRGGFLGSPRPDDWPAVAAAALGLDVAIPEHRAAVDAALWCQVRPDTPDSPSSEGVRSDLTPNEPAPQPPPGGQHEPAGERTEPLSGPGPGDLLGQLDAYRGTRDPFAAGTFAMYAAPDGSVVLVTDVAGRGVERNVLPAKLVRLALGMASGRGGILGRLFR